MTRHLRQRQMVPHLTELPETVLLKIFSYLSAEDLMLGVKPTCQYFYELSLAPELWKQIPITCHQSSTMAQPPFGQYSSNFYLKRYDQKCIRRSGCVIESESEDDQCIPAEERILQVKDVITSITEDGEIWPRCSVSEDMVCPNLRKLTLIRRENFPTREFLTRFTALQYLQIEVGPVFDFESSLTSQNVIALFRQLKTLTSLRTLKLKCGYGVIDLMSEVDDIRTSMVGYFRTSPKLTCLKLNFCLNEELVRTILDHCSQLEDIAFSLPQTTAGPFEAVVTDPILSLTSLKVADCLNLNDKTLRAMSAAFPNIRHLDLTLSEEATDAGLGHVLACSQLTSLKLTVPPFGYSIGNTLNITDRCLQELAKKVGNLQSLVLNKFTLDESVFKGLCQRQQNLHTVELIACKISSSAARALAGCPELRTVIINQCGKVDSTPVPDLMRSLPHLKTLHCKLLCDTKRIMGDLVVCETESQSQLRSLQLHPCEDLTPENMSALTSFCPNLLQLDLAAQNLVNDDTIRMILRSLPKLQHLKLEALSHDQEENTVTGACLREIPTLGTCLQELWLLSFGSFSSADVAYLVAKSDLTSLKATFEKEWDAPDCDKFHANAGLLRVQRKVQKEIIQQNARILQIDVTIKHYYNRDYVDISHYWLMWDIDVHLRLR